MLLVDTEPIVVDFCRVGMDVGIIELRFLSRRDLTLEPVAPIEFRPLSCGAGRIRQGPVRRRRWPVRCLGSQEELATAGLATGSKAKPGGAETRLSDGWGRRCGDSAAEAAAPTPLVQPRLLIPRPAVRPPDLLRGPGRGRPDSRGNRAAWVFDSWQGHSAPRAAVLTVRSGRDVSQTDVLSSCILAAQASRPRGPGGIAKNALLAPGAGGSTRISATRCRQEIA